MAINQAIIRIRRGLKEELQIDKLLPGELAMATNAPIMWFCWSPGEVEQIPTNENIGEVIEEITKKYLSEYAKKTDIPTKTSQLQNDSNFLTEHQDLSGYAEKATSLAGYGITDGATKEEFNQLSQEIDDLENEISSRDIVVSKRGTSIVSTDSSDNPLKGLKTFGKSTQRTTTGSQLAYIDIGNANHGVSYTEKDGNILVNGTATEKLWSALCRCNLEAGKTYTLSSATQIQLNVWDAVAGASFKSKLRNEKSVTFTANNTGMYVVSINEDSGFTYSNILADIMVNEGEVALPWEPYTNGASPNPEYPQPIESVGDDGSVEVGVYGGNLLPNTATSPTSAVYVNEDGSITVNGTVDSTVLLEIGKIELKADTTYVLTGCPSAGKENTYKLDMRNETKTTVYGGDFGSGFQYTPENDVMVSICIRVQSGFVANNLTFYPMIRLASIEDDTYEPYKPKQPFTISTPNGLPGIPVTDASLATYTDENGVMWRADEKDYKRGVYIQRVCKGVLDGSVVKGFNNGGTWHMSFDTVFGNGVGIVQGNTNGGYYALCNTFWLQSLSYKCDGQYENSMFFGSTSDNKTISFNISRGLFETQDEAGFKKFFTEHPTTIIALLETPIETPLSEEELEAYKALTMNYPTTTILNDADAYMEVKYAVDAQNHIEQNYVPKSEFTSLANRVSALEKNAL